MDSNDLPSFSSSPSSLGNYSAPSPNSSTMHLFNLNTMHQADVNTMNFDGQTAYTAVPAFNTAAPNATATNNNDFLGLLSPAQLTAFDLNPAFPSVPFTSQNMPMTSTLTSSSMPIYEMIPPVLSNPNLLPLPADANNLLMGLSEAQLQLCEHLFQLPGSHSNNNLTTHDGTTVFPDLNLLHAGSNGGGIWLNVPPAAQDFTAQFPPTTTNHGNQGFVMTNTLLPTSSILSVDQQQRQQQHQQDMSCLLEPPTYDIFGTTTGSSGQSSDLLVVPYNSNVPGPTHQMQQQQQPTLATQLQPILASQQPILASQQQRIVASQQYYPTTSVNNNTITLAPPVVSSSSPNSSSAIAQYTLQQQQHHHHHHQQQQQQKQEMHDFYQHAHQQEQMRLQQQLQEQQQLQQLQEQQLQEQQLQEQQLQQLQEQQLQEQQLQQLQEQQLQEQQLQQLQEQQLQEQQQQQIQFQQERQHLILLQKQLIYSQGDATTSAPATLSSSVAAHIPVSFSQPASDTWTVNPHAAITVPVSSTGPASPVDDLSSRNSSVSLGTPLAKMVPRSNPHQLRIQQQKGQLTDLNGIFSVDVMTVDQQLLAAAIDLKNLQYQDELRIQNQTLRQQSQQQEVGDGWVNQAQVQAHPKIQAQLHAQGASLQGSPDRDGTGSGDGSNGTDQSTLFQGAAHREEFLNYRGYRYHGYGEIPGGTSQAPQRNRTQTATSQAVQNNQGVFDYLPLSLASAQQQPTVGQNQVTASHGSPSTGTLQSSPAQAAQMQAPPASETSEASSVANTLRENNNRQVAPLYFPPYPTTNINHNQTAAARNNNNNNNNSGGSNSSQQPNMITVPSSSSSHPQKQDGSNNNSQKQSTQHSTLPPIPSTSPQEQEQEQQQDLYYGFSFEPQEGFEKKGDWPSLATGAPLSEAAVPSLIQALHGTVKDSDDFGPQNVHYATAQLQLFADMTLSDAFSSGQYNNNLLTRNILTGGAGSIIEYPAIQTGDEVVVVMKREKKSSLNCIYTEADEKTLKEQGPRPWKRPRRNNTNLHNEVDPFFAQAVTQVPQPSRPVPGAVPIAVAAANTNTTVNNVNRKYDDDADYVLPPPPIKPARRSIRVSKKGAVQKSSSSSSPPAEPQVWICPIPHCNRQFASFGLLKSHKVSHDPHKPYWCDICSEDGITPRPVSPTPIYPGIPVATPEVKKYKRHHDLLRHKREQHPPLEVKIQRFKEKMEAKEARRLKAEETRREKAAAKRLANAAAGRPATGRRRNSSATTTTTASAPRSRRASSTANATAPDTDHADALDVPGASKITRKRKSTETKRSSTNDDDDEEDDRDPDYQETELKRRRRSKTSSTSHTTPSRTSPTLAAATTRRRRSSADQPQLQQQQQQQHSANSVGISSSVPGLVFIPLQAPTGEQHLYGPQLLQAQVQQAKQAQAPQGCRRPSSTEQVKHEL